MNVRRALGGILAIALFALVGCAPRAVPSASPPPTIPTATGPVVTPATTPPATDPPGTPEASSAAVLSGWWGIDGTSFCVAPATYRTEDRMSGIGGCLGVLMDPPATIRIGVTQTLDLHMAIAPSNGLAFYPSPTTSNATVLAATASVDPGTVSWRGASVGTATLTTSGRCIDTATQHETTGECPVLTVEVVPIAFPGVVDLRPDGWSFLSNARDIPDFPTTSVEVYGPSEETTPPIEGPGRLALYETSLLETDDPAAYFDHRAELARAAGGRKVSVEVNGDPATVWVDDDTGELVLGWQVPAKFEVLVANRADFTIKQLVASAESLSECCG